MPAISPKGVTYQVEKKIEIRKFFPNLNHFLERIRHQKERILSVVNQLNSNFTNNSKIAEILYGPLTLAILIVSPLSVTLLPVNNVIVDPEYWYENVFSMLSWHFFLAIAVALNMKALLGDCIKKDTTRVIMELFVVMQVIRTLGVGIIHLIWSVIFQFYEPFPFRGMLIAALTRWATWVQRWHLIPKQMRRDLANRKRLRASVCSAAWIEFTFIQLLFLTVIIGRSPENYQWMIALLFPLTKEFNDRVYNKFVTKTASPENQVEAKFIGKIAMNLMYSFWLAIICTMTATKYTEYALLSVNFCLDLTLCFRYIKLDRKVSENNSESQKTQGLKKEVLTELILNEFVEVLVPIAFIAAYSIAYHGPNKNTLGSIGCVIWQYEKVKTLQNVMIPVAEMALIDSGSVIVAGLLLWRFCRISIWNEYCATIKRYWIYLAIWGGNVISAVSSCNI